MARLRAFASDGVWPSNTGNRPAPRQKKWHALYQKPPPVTPKSVGSESSSYAPRSFLRSSPSLSKVNEEPAACVLQSVAAGDAGPGWLPSEMRKTIPVQDQRWIGNTIFHGGK
ncbi:hypothetical protein GOODEAATRI_025975, partial [Goodea atripinnis]